MINSGAIDITETSFSSHDEALNGCSLSSDVDLQVHDTYSRILSDMCASLEHTMHNMPNVLRGRRSNCDIQTKCQLMKRTLSNQSVRGRSTSTEAEM